MRNLPMLNTTVALATSATIATQRRAALPARHAVSVTHNTSKMREVDHPKSVRCAPTKGTVMAMVFAIGTVVVNPLFVPAAAAQHCEVVGCWTECHRVPGGRWCQRRCTRRCWRPAPRYEPPPYVSPPYVAPVHQWNPMPQFQTVQLRLDPAVLLALGGAGIVILLLVIAAATSERVAVNRVHRLTDAANQEAADAEALREKATVTADDIDRYIDQRLKDAYDRGRNSLPEYRHG